MAMKKIMKDERTSLILGDKIKGYGDPNSRTRKRLEHQPYMVRCTMYMYMYVQCTCMYNLKHISDTKSLAGAFKIHV